MDKSQLYSKISGESQETALLKQNANYIKIFLQISPSETTVTDKKPQRHLAALRFQFLGLQLSSQQALNHSIPPQKLLAPKVLRWLLHYLSGFKNNVNLKNLKNHCDLNSEASLCSSLPANNAVVLKEKSHMH